ncbi:MAG: type II toxin-antitoxin system HipA family toxin [bacterium]
MPTRTNNVKEERKMDKISAIEVFISKQRVGRLALTPENLCVFEYDSEWIANGYSISPFHLPLKNGLQIAKREPFAGGFGVFDDSLPDGWGNLILDRYLSEKGINPDKLTLLDRLALIGTNGRGALEFYPDNSITKSEDFVNFDKIAHECEIILGDKKGEVNLEDLYHFGSSSGGARPKIFTSVEGRNWLVKFRASSDPQNIGEIEYNYSQLAKECGIVMSETKLFNSKYFGTERFDRTENGRVHTISAAGLLNANYRIPSIDYSTLLKVTLLLTRSMEQVIQMFQLMVFNILISNRDDHAKNFSFQYIDSGWKLSPSYDILPSKGFNGYHTTSINGRGEPTRKDIIAVAKEVSIAESDAEVIIDEITAICNAKNMLKFTPK